ASASRGGLKNPAWPLDAKAQAQRPPIKTTISPNRFLQIAAASSLARRRIFGSSNFDCLSSATGTARWFASESDSSLIRRHCLKRSRRRFPSRFFQMIQLLPQLKILLAYQPVDFRKLSLAVILTSNNVYNVGLYSRFFLCRIINSPISTT